MTVVIAHRGASRAEPENTLAAFGRAAEMGADGVELDARRTRDDRLVVHHDPMLADGRTIRDTARADLPTAVPDLADAIAACEGMFINIEIKNDPTEPDYDPSDWVAHRLASLLAQWRSPTRWLVSSFRLETVAVMRRLIPAVRTAWLVHGPTVDAIATAARANHAALHPRVDLVDESSIRRAHGVGIALNTWTCDDPARLRELMAWGVDGICTNVPDVAIALRAEIAGGRSG